MDNNIDKNILRDERIDAYFRGKMTTEVESQFMKDVAADEDLRQKVVALARLAKGMKEVGKEQDELIKSALKSTSRERTKQMLEEILRKEKERESASECSVADILAEEPKKRRWPLFISIAASLAIVVGVGVTFLQRSSTVELGEQYYMAFESSIVRGSEDANIPKQLTPLFEMVKQGEDLDKAIPELRKLWEQASKDEYNDYIEYAPEIGWNLTIAYLKDSNRDKAKEVLNQLIPLLEENSALYNKAIELKERL